MVSYESDLLAVELVLEVERYPRLERGGDPSRIREDRQRLVQAAEGPRAKLVGPGGEAEPLGHGELRLADLASLGRDDHDAVGGLGAVDRGGRPTLQDLDPLDVLGIEIGDAIDRVVLVPRVAAALGAAHRVLAVGDCRVADHDAVHHDTADPQLPLMVDTPRRLSWMPPPGAPELAWM